MIPDMYKYYQVALVSRMIDGCRHGDLKIWPRLEQAQSRELLLRAPWCFRDLPSMTKSHPTIRPTLRICNNLFAKGKLSSRDSPLVPVLGNPQFILGLRKGSFDLLIKQGLYQALHFLRAGCRPTVQELTDRNGPFQLDFWQVVQQSHFLHTRKVE